MNGRTARLLRRQSIIASQGKGDLRYYRRVKRWWGKRTQAERADHRQQFEAQQSPPR